MTYIGQNIKYLRTKRNFTQGQLAELLGVKRNTISNYESEISTPDYEMLSKIVKILDVDYNTIISVKLDDSNTYPTSINGSENVSESLVKYGDNIKPVLVTVDNAGRENIVMVSKKAAAGYPQHYFDPEFLKKQPTFSLPGGEFRNATFRCFEVKGDSMQHTIYNGDWVIGMYVEPPFNIKEGYIYVIVTKDSLLVKRLGDRVKERNKYVLYSDNEDYVTRQIEADEVLEVWYVKAKLSFTLPNTKHAIDRKIADLQADFLMLKDEIDQIKSKKKP